LILAAEESEPTNPQKSSAPPVKITDDPGTVIAYHR
jgi:hypothetical protein